MKKVLVLFLISVLLFMMDNFLMPYIGIRGVYPSILLCFCILYSIQNGKWEGMWLGVFCGLLQDLYFTNVFGLNAIINMFICLIAGEIGTKIFREKKLVPVASCFLLSFLKGLAIFAFFSLTNVSMSFSRVLFVSFYDLVIAFFLYKWVYRLCQEYYMQVRWKF